MRRPLYVAAVLATVAGAVTLLSPAHAQPYFGYGMMGGYGPGYAHGYMMGSGYYGPGYMMGWGYAPGYGRTDRSYRRYRGHHLCWRGSASGGYYARCRY